MTNLIVQYTDKKLEDWSKISTSHFRKYADKWGVEYEFSNKLEFADVHYFDNLKIIYLDKYDKYDKILYVDVDMAIENFDINIFDEKIEDVGICLEYYSKNMKKMPRFYEKAVENEYRNACGRFDLNVIRRFSGSTGYTMFNSGMILWSKKGRTKARDRFMDWKLWNSKFKNQMSYDQPYLTSQITNHLDYTELKYSWNCPPLYRFDNPPDDMRFIHYTGGKKKLMRGIYQC